MYKLTYTDNKNNLQEFFAPCFVPALKSKTYVIPIINKIVSK